MLSELDRLELRRSVWDSKNGNCDFILITEFEGNNTTEEEINLDFELIDNPYLMGLDRTTRNQKREKEKDELRRVNEERLVKIRKIQEARRYNLELKRQKEKKIQEAREFNLMMKRVREENTMIKVSVR